MPNVLKAAAMAAAGSASTSNEKPWRMSLKPTG